MYCYLVLALYVEAKAVMRYVQLAATTMVITTLRAALVVQFGYLNLAILYSAVIA
jgi:hypothetical protein